MPLDAWVQHRHPVLFERYLSRYRAQELRAAA